MTVRILLVDDDSAILELLAMRLQASGFNTVCAASGEEALTVFSRLPPDIVITDLKMGGMDGIALFDALQTLVPGLPVIVLTAHGTIPDAVAATRRGVFGFIPKPFESGELLEEVNRAVASLPNSREDDAWRADIVGSSQSLRQVLDRAQRVASAEANIHVRGASGTGKEVLARALHRASRRAGGPFVAINCAAIPEALLESELFGHRKGAFTGATYDHPGLFVSAEKGTLFLDEIGDMPLVLQAKLLRVIQDRMVRAVGATHAQPIDVRIISATHHDLELRMKEGGFREDLYYRLNVVTLELPSLDARREDIPSLSRYLLEQTASRYGTGIPTLAPEAMALLVQAAWPGNIRQLQNVIEQAVALTPDRLIPASIVREALHDNRSGFTGLDDAKRAFERDYLTRLMSLTQGNVSKAAKMAQRNRTEFYNLLNRHEIDPGAFKRDAVATTIQ